MRKRSENNTSSLSRRRTPSSDVGVSFTSTGNRYKMEKIVTANFGGSRRNSIVTIKNIARSNQSILSSEKSVSPIKNVI